MDLCALSGNCTGGILGKKRRALTLTLTFVLPNSRLQDNPLQFS